ncbi:zinc ribbon domain-containing protein [Bacteroidota bacterium]
MYTYWIILGFVLVVSAVYSGFLASQKGFNSLAWFIGGLFFGPFALIAAAGLPDRGVKERVTRTKICPDCKEIIILDATVCRYCGHTFDEGKILDEFLTLIKSSEEADINDGLDYLDEHFKLELVDELLALRYKTDFMDLNYPEKVKDKITAILCKQNSTEISDALTLRFNDDSKSDNRSKIIIGNLLSQIGDPKSIPVILKLCENDLINLPNAEVYLKRYGQSIAPFMEEYEKSDDKRKIKLAKLMKSSLKKEAPKED